jgi:hypothetical protein
VSGIGEERGELARDVAFVLFRGLAHGAQQLHRTCELRILGLSHTHITAHAHGHEVSACN